MNLFFVYGSGDDARIVTPELTGTLLPGVTRDSLLTLAARPRLRGRGGADLHRGVAERQRHRRDHRGVRLRHRRGDHPGRRGQGADRRLDGRRRPARPGDGMRLRRRCWTSRPARPLTRTAGCTRSAPEPRERVHGAPAARSQRVRRVGGGPGDDDVRRGVLGGGVARPARSLRRGGGDARRHRGRVRRRGQRDHHRPVVGAAAGHVRNQLVVATKGRFATGPGPNGSGLSRKHLTAALDASLHRLGVERVDLYQVHA